MTWDMHQYDGNVKQIQARSAAVENNCDLMTHEIYPLAEIIDRFKSAYFVNSICYMIAYALFLGTYDEIDFYGCYINTQPQDTEIPCKNHPGVEHWIGYAMGRGVRVKIHGDSFLLRCKDGLYGYRA